MFSRRGPHDQNDGDDPSLVMSDKASHILNQHSHLNLTDVIEFVDYDIRGCGGYSDVYYGLLATCNKYVAIKRLRAHVQREMELSKVCNTLAHYLEACSHIAQNIARELQIWASLTHPNVLPLLGYISSQGATFAFISEWMENGTVRDFLKTHPDTDRMKMV
jgi:serine/threonine protein kinase